MSLVASGSTIATSSSSDAQEQDRVVLILCGLIASGKSTFAEALQHHYPHFRRCNQDDLGDRRAVEQLARECLEQGLSVCVDRTNFNAAQRAYWIDIAREFSGTKVWVIVFDTPYDTCAARLQTRTAHPTIKSPAQGLSVLARFAADFQEPRPHEGYERILFLQPADHPSAQYTAADVAAILQRVRNAPPIVPVPPPVRGGRGRGHGHGYGYANRPSYGYGSGYRGGDNGGSRSFRGGNSNSRGRGARGGGGYYNQYQQQNNGRGRGGAAYRGAYRGDGVGLYGGRPGPHAYSAHRPQSSTNSTSPTAQQSSTGRPAQTTTLGAGHPREDVLPIDD